MTNPDDLRKPPFSAQAQEILQMPLGLPAGVTLRNEIGFIITGEDDGRRFLVDFLRPHEHEQIMADRLWNARHPESSKAWSMLYQLAEAEADATKRDRRKAAVDRECQDEIDTMLRYRNAHSAVLAGSRREEDLRLVEESREECDEERRLPRMVKALAKIAANETLERDDKKDLRKGWKQLQAILFCSQVMAEASHETNDLATDFFRGQQTLLPGERLTMPEMVARGRMAGPSDDLNFEETLAIERSANLIHTRHETRITQSLFDKLDALVKQMGLDKEPGRG